MSGRAPSPHQLERAMAILLPLREQLQAIEPGIAEDQRLLADMLEGEAGDALAVVEQVIEAAIEADAMADACKARQDALAERKARFERRRDTLRNAAQAALEALELRRLERPAFTASIQNRPPSVTVTDEAELPLAFVRTTFVPNRSAIAAALKAGQDVPGATLNNAGPSLSIRTK